MKRRKPAAVYSVLDEDELLVADDFAPLVASVQPERPSPPQSGARPLEHREQALPTDAPPRAAACRRRHLPGRTWVLVVWLFALLLAVVLVLIPGRGRGGRVAAPISVRDRKADVGAPRRRQARDRQLRVHRSPPPRWQFRRSVELVVRPRALRAVARSYVAPAPVAAASGEPEFGFER